MIYWTTVPSPIGPIWLAASDAGLVYCSTPGSSAETMFEWLRSKLPNRPLQQGENEHILEAGRQLRDYLAGQGRELDVPLDLIGTEFQLKVWRALQQIPYGETRSYGQIAKAVGSPRAARAVGGANLHNPVALFVP